MATQGERGESLRRRGMGTTRRYQTLIDAIGDANGYAGRAWRELASTRHGNNPTLSDAN